MNLIFCAFALSITLAAGHAHAADSAVSSMLSMSVSLGIVLAAIAAAALFFKRMQPGVAGGAQRPLLNPVAQYALGAWERIVVVEMGDNWLVLGVTASSINLLSQQPRGELPANAPQLPAQAFADVLRKLMNKK